MHCVQLLPVCTGAGTRVYRGQWRCVWTICTVWCPSSKAIVDTWNGSAGKLAGRVCPCCVWPRQHLHEWGDRRNLKYCTHVKGIIHHRHVFVYVQISLGLFFWIIPLAFHIMYAQQTQDQMNDMIFNHTVNKSVSVCSAFINFYLCTWSYCWMPKVWFRI